MPRLRRGDAVPVRLGDGSRLSVVHGDSVKPAQILEKLKDPVYFIERFFFIVNKRRERVPFRLNPPQRRFYENRSLNDLIMKARKEGFSSLVEALFLHSCMYEENQNCVTMAHTWEETVIHLDRVKFFLENMGLRDTPFNVELDKESQRELFFPQTNSRYWIGTAGAKAFGRGRDITKLHLSEVAHYENTDVITGVMEACVPGAWKVLETTANGMELFFDLWQEAQDPQSESPWKCHFFAWFEDPTNRAPLPTNINFRPTSVEQRMKDRFHLDDEQIYWWRLKRAEMPDKEKMPQEFPSEAREAFLSSGRPAFDQELLSVKIERAKKNPPLHVAEIEDDGQKVRMIDGDEGRLKVWKAPRKGRSYLIAADSGEGVPEGDFSVAQVFDRSSWEQVAVWRGRIDPGEFGRLLVSLGKFYEWAVLIPELNNHGWATVEAIKAEQYPHLFNTKEIWKEGETPKDGFPTTEKTRNLIITAIRNAINESTSVINDPVTLGEMQTFVQNENTHKFEAMEGRHDDCVISFGIGVYAVKFLTVDETYDVESRHRFANPMLTKSAVGSSGRRSATGYR